MLDLERRCSADGGTLRVGGQLEAALARVDLAFTSIALNFVDTVERAAVSSTLSWASTASRQRAHHINARPLVTSLASLFIVLATDDALDGSGFGVTHALADGVFEFTLGVGDFGRVLGTFGFADEDVGTALALLVAADSAFTFVELLVVLLVLSRADTLGILSTRSRDKLRVGSVTAHTFLFGEERPFLDGTRIKLALEW